MMSLPQVWSFKTKVMLVALGLALGVPTVASARFFFWWWLRPPAPPVQDVTFLDVSTSNSRAADVYFLDNQFEDFEIFHLEDLSGIGAQVTSEQITFDQIVLTDGVGTTATLDIAQANLVTDAFGSSFRSTVSISLVTPSGSSTINGHISGRISERNDLYNMRAIIGGLAPEDLGGGSVVYHLIRVYLSGATAVPSVP